MILYGIPNCDTVRKARKFLETSQVHYQFHDFRKDGLTLEVIENWLKHQSIDTIVNKRSTAWKQLDETQKQQLMDAQQLELLSEIPTLIKRPVLQTDTKLLFGFNPSEYENLI